MNMVLLYLLIFSVAQSLEGNENFLKGEPVIISVDRQEMEGGAMAGILINEEAGKIFDVLVDVVKFPLFMPSLDKTEIIEEKENIQIVRFYVKKAFISISYTLKRELHRDRMEITWVNFDDTFKLIRGYWRLEPLDEKRTSVIYYTYLVPGFMIPQVIVDYLEERSLPDMLRALKNWIEKGIGKKEKKEKRREYEF